MQYLVNELFVPYFVELDSAENPISPGYISHQLFQPMCTS